ncbi:MAG: hypothetical protein O7A98_01190, partial [Acidobacteria bacterium]|nr:hypothetical protein [Acidobacteriota bacterium]
MAHADIEIVAETGVQAPGEAAGVEFSTLREPVIGGAGHVAFGAELSGPGIITSTSSLSNNEVIFAGIPRSLRKVVQENDPAPGTAPDVVFLNLPQRIGDHNRIAVSDSGDVAVYAVLRGPGIDAFNRNGVWAEIDGSLVLIARTGQLLPGGAMLAALTDFSLTDAGVTLFVNADPGGREIWLYRGGALELIAAEGDPAPGFADCTFGQLFRPVASPSGKL